jgi:DNA adenine methylase
MLDQTNQSPHYSAKLLSPFRYPGGKTWLVPYVCHWLHSMKPRPAMFVEPFAGGGIVGLNVAHRRLAGHVTLVELDEDVAAVWQTILNGNAESLTERITTFEMSRKTVRVALSRTPQSLEERAFQTILKNRVNRAGILASGAGMLRNGENGRGIRSRWYPETLKRRITKIDRMRERITFIEGDGLSVLTQYALPTVATHLAELFSRMLYITPGVRVPFSRCSVGFFIDPPYTAGGKLSGKRLYRYHELDHEKLFSIVSRLRGDFLMTYSSDDTVRELADRHRFDVEEISMRSSHHVKMPELLIGRDLSWIRRLQGGA